MTEDYVNIVIADKQFLVCWSLQNILQKDDRYKVSKIVSNKYDLINALKQEKLSLLIIDSVQMDFENFGEISEIQQNFPDIHILILTNTIARNELLEINASGIKNILLKTIDEEELFEAISATLKGRKYYSPEILEMLIEANEKKANMEETGQLTATEIEIVRLIAEGLTTKDIAAHKHISFHTVISHRKNIFRKLHVSSVSELIMFAIKAGWIDNIEYFI